ncbi:MAG: sulfotransferase family 2 domain-containing protein [Woeseiaceae bacterium]
MIISHRHKFIFFAVPKTATHTIREALRQHTDENDWEQQVLYGQQFLPFPEIARLNHGHISAEQIRPHLDDDIWNEYFKFGFVRNPFDRFVSTCFFLNRSNPNFAQTAVQFMKQRLPLPRFRQRILVKPQYQQLCWSGGDVALDYVGRYESLQQSYDEICERIGISGSELGVKNTSKHKTFDTYYDEDLRNSVAEFYAEDLRIFDYAFPSS